MTTTSTTDVLIVGAGPAGTALAIDLARRGVAVRLIDKAPHAFDGSRAKGVQPRTLEVLEDLGALPDVLDQGTLSRRWASISAPSPSRTARWPKANALPTSPTRTRG